MAERAFVWLGGALFVAALAWMAYALLFTWGEARPFAWDPAVRSMAVNTALFTLFAAHHSVFARAGVKSALARVVPDRLLRSVYVWVASLLLIAVIAAWQPVGGLLYTTTGWPTLAYAVVQLAGVWLIGRAVGAIDGLELAGIRSAPAHEDPSTPLRAGLETGGVYRLVRHPIYFGTVLILFGHARMTGDRLLFAILATLYLVIAVRWEERSLERAFGTPYREYQRQVRWRIVPFLY